MTKLNIRETQNPAIIKFEFPDFITTAGSFEYKNIDEAKASPLAQQLFYLPFVKTVFISGNFIAIERYNIVEWDDVKEDVAEQIENFVNDGGTILNAESPSVQKKPVTVYGEITPNPSAIKFVSSIMLTRTPVEYKNIDATASSPLARELFNFPFVKELYFDENYISVTKYDIYDWNEITNELRTFIKQYIENGGPVLDESQIATNTVIEAEKEKHFDTLDTTSQQIINILEEFVKPAVAADGGNIVFESFDSSDKTVRVILQGACNGCPSSTFTLKSGIQSMLQDMLKDDDIRVEAVNG